MYILTFFIGTLFGMVLMGVLAVQEGDDIYDGRS